MGYSSDILADGLSVVFCGINPAVTAAQSGHNFSHPSNRFWSVLHLAGFTDHRLRPEQEHQLLTYKCGITAVVSRPTTRASDVTSAEIAPQHHYSRPGSGTTPLRRRRFSESGPSK